MSKHKRKRFLSILITAVLVFTLALSSVMAQDSEHVRTDKLSVGGESVEVIEGVTGEDDADAVADEAVTSDDAEAVETDADEAAETEEELPAGEVTEEADADVPDAAEDDADADAGIMTLSAADTENEDEYEYGIQTLADTTVYVGSSSDYSTLNDAVQSITSPGSYDEIKIMLLSDVTEDASGHSITFAETTFTLDLNGFTVDMNKDSHMEVNEGATLILTDSAGGGAIDNAYDLNNSGGTIIVKGTLKMESGAITNGGTGKSGGAVSVESGGTFEMSGGTISGNTASENGSGVYVGNGSTFTMTGGVITGNDVSSPTTKNDYYGNGGGVVVAVGGTFVLDGGSITENKAYHGGGVVSGGTFTMKSGTISGNETTDGGSGGGVIIYNTVEDTTETFTMSGGEISGNTSAYKGGGLVLFSDGKPVYASMSGGTISGNTASNSGGGVYVDTGCSFTMSGDAVISENEASGHGGGVYVSANGTFTMNNGTMDANKATESSSKGGGVYVPANATFIMNGGTISNSVAKSNGGGVYVEGNFTLAGGTITGNQGDHGGGVDVNTSNASCTVLGGSVTGNTAVGTSEDEHGGGVSNLYLAGNNQYITLGASLSGKAQIGVKMETGNAGPTENSSVRFTTIESDTSYYATSASYFFSDEGYGVRSNESKYLELYLMSFEEKYLTGDDGALYTAVTAENYEQILSGASDWDAMSEAEQAAVNVLLTEAWQAAGNMGELTYEDLLAQAQAMDFEDSYLTGEDGKLYTEATADNYKQILAGADDWDALSDEAKAAVNADLTAANGGETLTYPMLLAAAQAIADEANAFEESYLGGADSLYTEATADNYQDILAGASDWDAMSDEAKAAVNADLTAAWQAAGNTGELTYEDLLAQAQALADANAFEESYLGGADSLYTEATAENYQEILAGASDWDAMSDEAKAAVNADLTAAWQAAGNEGELTYEDLLAQAQAVADANAFEESYLGGASSLYTEATADNYQEILAGASDWANMSDEAKAQVNADLTAAWQAAGNEGELTYDDLLAQAFELAYLTDDSGNGPYTEVTADNIDQILSGADDWALMSDEAKAAVNAALQDASGDSGMTYDDLLAQAFEQKYLMADGDGNLYTEATADNYQQILAGEADWDALSDEAKAKINADLTAANGGTTLTYPMLLEQAKAFSAAADFIYNYVSDNDVDNPYLMATQDNYQRILAGEDAWNAMSEAEQDAVNAMLTAAWQAAGNEGELTYPMLLEQAKAFAASLGNVKTGDSTHLYLYVILAAAAAAAAAGAAVSRRRRV